jgi:hypothetical protein
VESIAAAYVREPITPDCMTLVRNEARRWRYRPFAPGGEPIELTITEIIPIYPPERWHETHTPFPEIEDLSAVRIILERLGCYGECPSYRVELRGDGSSTFFGYSFVRAVGEHHDTVNREEFARLVQLFRQADLFSLENAYTSPVVDMSTDRITLIIGSQQKIVVDYEGLSVGMPLVVSQLEDEIDRVGRTQQWIERREPPS